MSCVRERPWWPTQSSNKERNKEESERLRGERDQIKLIDLRFEKWQVLRLSELCSGKAIVAIQSPNKERKKEESETLRGERDQIKSIDFRFERWQAV